MVISDLRKENHSPEAADIDVERTPRPLSEVPKVLPRHTKSYIRSLDQNYELFRDFVEHIAAGKASSASGSGFSPATSVEWMRLKVEVADSQSIEQALGRAVIIAHRMRWEPSPNAKGALHEPSSGNALPESSTADALHEPRPGAMPPPPQDDAFFAFSVADTHADFGDLSRYRSRVTSKVARVFKPRGPATAAAS